MIRRPMGIAVSWNQLRAAGGCSRHRLNATCRVGRVRDDY